MVVGVAQPGGGLPLQASSLGGLPVGPVAGDGPWLVLGDDPAATPGTLAAAAEQALRLDVAAAPLDVVAASVSDLDRQLALVGAQVEAARSELAVAEVDRDRLAAAVTETQRRIDALHGEVAEQAVSMYVAPQADRLEVFTRAADLDQSVRRQGLMKTLIEANERAVDDLLIARQDLLSLQAALAASDARAGVLQGTVDDGTGRLAAAGRRRAEVAASLAARVGGLDAEIVGQQQGRAQLLRLLSRADLEAEEQAEEQAQRRLSSPIDATITSEFGSRWGRQHEGVDFESDIGVPLRAAKGGVVVEAGWIDGYGQTIVIDHGGGLTTLYAHQSAFAVEAGERVERGQLIGYVGVTGTATGPNLHFETRQGDVPVDPRNYLS